jgi:outer membrane lipoprotein-sorting protein
MTMKTPAVALLILTLLWGSAHGWTAADSEALLDRMETAYEKVQEYETRLVITGFGKDDAFKSRQELIYRFKKPNRLRIDFITPHAGMTILYPASDGKVLLQPSGWASVFTLRLAPRNSLLEISPGQQIDQTHHGVLIANIRRTLTDMFQGELEVQETPDRTLLNVLSDNTFRRGVPTRYLFTIDNRLWLPVSVTEMEPNGALRRTVDYRDVRINPGLSEAFFVLLDPVPD